MSKGKESVGFFRKLVDSAKEDPLKATAAIAGVSSLGVAAANLSFNRKRTNAAEKYQREQLKAMDNLTKSISTMDTSLRNTTESQKKLLEELDKRGRNIKFSPKDDRDPRNERRSGGFLGLFRRNYSINSEEGMVKFKRKDFSLSDDVTTGAKIGAGVGGVVGIASKVSGGGFGKTLAFAGIGTAVGAALGALVNVIGKETDRANRQATVDARLMNVVVDDLKANGFKEGVQFTRDPKRANELRIRVSIVISRTSGELNLLINMVADDRLKDLSKDIITRFPNHSAVTTKLEDRYNEITVTTIADNSASAGLIAGICNYFIRNKYPVYLVEVG
jgi:hypothetical protein